MGDVVFDDQVLFHKSFGYAQPGEVIIHTNELMKVGVAVCQGNFSGRFQVGYGSEWEIEFRK